ncbi:flagellar hook assembly protein FlgD [Pseudooceanicola aestuarii]|uniref:flagellar hook assembly protein FlgD n=1 Tax=Pseudooceanicola aestuarii TaxID=2697319 RepID=UPI0013D2485C|nr:flagellar hook assembly protein FlgD [Pseudooceanicola aestuarii]
MAIDPLVGTGIASGSQISAAQGSLSELGADYQRFLTLLTAQISNQDPLEPMDSTTFVSQLAQLSQVEQSVVTNSNLEGLSAQLTSVAALAGVGMIGRTVTAPSDQLVLSDGAAEFQYRLGGAAEQVSALIRTSDGVLLREIASLPTEAESLHSVDWNGLDVDGLPVPDGTFFVEIRALDAQGAAVNTASYARAQVTGMNFDGGTTNLALANGELIQLGLVETIE